MEITDKLVMEALCGSQDAITRLYEGTYSNVYHTIKSMISDEDAALDILQDTYLKAFDSLVQLENPAQFRPWVKRIAANKAKDYLKRRRPILFSEMANEDSDEPIDFEDNRWTDLPETVVDRKETTRLIGEILKTLSEDQQLVVGMFYFQEMNVKQIAKILGVSENTVKSRLNYARKKIEIKVLDLEKKGTKLYSLAPLPFFLWLLRSMDAIQEVPNAAVLDAVCAENVAGYTSAAGGAGAKAAGGKAAARAGAKAAASAGAKAAAGGTAKALGVKIAAGVLAVAIAGGGAVAWAGSQKDEQPDAPSFSAAEEANLPAEAGAEPQEGEQAEAAVSPDTAYQGIVSQYADVLGANSQDFLNNPDGYFNGDHAVVRYYHTYPGMQFQYAYYDINRDGTEELLIGTDGMISDVYGFDGANAVQLIDEPSMGDRSQLTIYPDGSMILEGSGGAEYHSIDRYHLDGANVIHENLVEITPEVIAAEGGDNIYNSMEKTMAEAIGGQQPVENFNWQPIEATQQAPAASVSAEEAYQAVLNQYLGAMEIDHQAFVDAFSRGDYGAYFAADDDAMVGYHFSSLRSVGLDVLYAYYDIDHNGTDELLISSIEDGGGSYEISAVYGFNGSEAVRLLRNPVELDSRAHLYINQDGTVETSYTDMETGSLKRQVWQLNGCSLEETTPSGAEGVWEFDWNPIGGSQGSTVTGNADDAYQIILRQYYDSINADNQDFMDAYGRNDYTAYYNGDHMALYFHHMNLQNNASNVGYFYCAYYDLNGDGTDEMLIGNGFDGQYGIIDLYGFDGSTAVQLVDDVDLGCFSALEVLADGTVRRIDGGSNISYWRLASDGSTLTEAASSNAETVTNFNWLILA